ncbi:MFS transporter [Desulfotomaculum copahuensis]|uniref:MFS transporter n=1 Tax=Desulfotomaculum copahuensis TaxID=1838280 RepID=A0A1B7LE31_9FIRM|nr:MFS transporter [Desulfotomaculum copahuensis]OAT81357.1 MFS transporter [Desulfotomaculum copahuensis]
MKPSNYRWIIIGMVFLITVINYVDRSAIAFAMPILSKLFHLNEEHIGLTLGAFNIGYAALCFFGGLMVDKWGSRKVWLIAALIWSVSIFSTAFAAGFAFLFTVRLFLGLAEGPNFPALNRVVGDWLPSKERAVALANALVSVPLALMLGGPIVSQLAIHFSWRGMFMILGGLGIIWAPLWFFLFRDFPEHSVHVNDAELSHIREQKKVSRDISEQAIRKHQHASSPGMWRFLLTNPTLLSNDWAFFVFGYNLFFFLGWLPTFLSKSYGMDLQHVGMFTILPWALASILLYFVGHLSDRILKSTGNLRLSRSYPIWISQLLGALSLLPVIMYHSLSLSLISISLAVGFNMASNSTFYAVNVDMIKEKSGTALGIMDFFFAVAGLIASTLTGFIVQLSGSFHGAFVLVIILNLTSVFSVLLFHRPDNSTLEKTTRTSHAF